MKIKNKIARTMVLAVVAAVAIAGLSDFQVAAAAKKPIQKMLSQREITGEVLSFTPRNKPQNMVIAVDKENADYMFYIDETTKVAHKKSLSEIMPGDTVRVAYTVFLETAEDGRQWERTIAQTITFVRSAASIKGLRSE